MPANVLNLEQTLQTEIFPHVLYKGLSILENVVLAPPLFPLYHFASICGAQMSTCMVNA